MRTRSLEVIILDFDSSDRGSSPNLAVIFVCDFLFLFSVSLFVIVIFPV